MPLNQSQISVLRAMFDNEAKSITVANLFCNKQSRIDAALEYIDKKFTNYVPQTNDFYQYLVWSNSKYFSREFSLTVLRTTLPMALSALGLERFSNVFGAGSGTPPPPENEATINWLPLLAVGGGLLLFGFNNDEKPKK